MMLKLLTFPTALSIFIVMLAVQGLTRSKNLAGLSSKRYVLQKYASVMKTPGDFVSNNITKNFIVNIIENDLKVKKNGGRVVTRFPPEPNGYLHLGHAKSINFNFGVAKSFQGVTHMRFDDTNPAKEDMEFVQSILEDVRWLVSGSTSPDSDPWYGEVRYTSQYFQAIYDAAEFLISQNLAYVDDLSFEEMREYRGTLTEPGKESPFRDRSVEENLRLFREMKAGKFNNGKKVLRAKIDMTSSNMNLRDPTLYRIKNEPHPVTGSEWCIYPMYDFAHAISDALEGITHSLCTLEFENHRPLYDWIIDNLLPAKTILPHAKQGWRPTQYEFSRLNMQYTVLSKRKLIQLVTENHVEGWDDPRMPTICGLRRRGFPPEAIRLFCERVGISKAENNIDMSVLEDSAREVLDPTAPRAFALVQPLKVTVSNWKEGEVETFFGECHPKIPELGQRALRFDQNLYIDREDFFDTGVNGEIKPPKGYKRLLPGGQVRLKYAYVITCNEVVRDPKTGQVVELICSYEAATRSGATPEGAPKVKGIIQWLSRKSALRARLSMYDRLFLTPTPGKEQEDGDFLKDLNPESLQEFIGAAVEPSVADSRPGSVFQFERIGYFALDQLNNIFPPVPGKPLKFNRVVTLRDNWSKPAGSDQAQKPKDDKTGGTSVPVEDIRRVEFRVGRILSVEKHPDADSLYVEKVDCGDPDGPRTIISGLVKHFTAKELMDRKVVVVCNLKPSKMRGILSEGMLLAASKVEEGGESEVVELLSPPEEAPVGELISVEGFAAPEPDAQLKSKTAQEVWKRVVAELVTTDELEGSYGQDKGRLITSKGPCTVNSLKNAEIR